MITGCRTFLCRNACSLLIVILYTCQAYAQPELQFENLNQKKGLVPGTTSAIIKDQTGFIWLGTENGLVRFDGQNYDLFNETSGHLFSKKIAKVFDLEIDKQQNLWVAHKGLLSINLKTFNNFNYPFIDETNNRIIDPRCLKVIIDNNERKWVLTDLGLFLEKDSIMEPAVLTYPSLVQLPKGGISISILTVKYDSIRDGLWVGTKRGLFFLELSSGKLFGRDNNPHKLDLFDIKNAVFTLAFNSNNLWLYGGDPPHQLFQYNFSDKNKLGGQLLSLADTIPSSNEMYVDSQERLWLSTYFQKVYLVANKNIHLLSDFSKPVDDQVNTNYIYSFSDVFEDNKQNLWFTTVQGLSKLNKSTSTVKKIELYGRHPSKYKLMGINRVKPANDSILWACTDKGLVKVNYLNGRTTLFTCGDVSSKANRFFDIIEFEDKLICGTGHGVKFFDLKTGKGSTPVNYVNVADTLRSAYWVLKDADHLWFALWEDAIYRMNLKTNEILRMADSTRYGDIGPNNSIVAYQDHQGTLWFNYGAKGIRCFDKKTNRFYNPVSVHDKYRPELDNAIVTAIGEDYSKNIVVSTSTSGIYKIKNGNVVEVYNNANSELKSNAIQDMTIDKNHNFWFSTLMGIYMLDRETNRIMKAAGDFGDIISFNIAYHKNNIIATPEHTLVLLNLHYDIPFTQLENPVVNSIQTEKSYFTIWNTSNYLNLDAGTQFVNFTFSSLENINFPTLRYSYKLEGVDHVWRDAYHQTVASYNSLNPGRYLFRVKITANGSDWIESKVPVMICIKPYFWETIWFKCGCVVLGLLAAYLLWSLYKVLKYSQRLANAVDYFASSVYSNKNENDVGDSIGLNFIYLLEFEKVAIYLTDEEKTLRLRSIVPTHEENQSMIESSSVLNPVSLNSVTRINKDRYCVLQIPMQVEGHLIGVLECIHTSCRNFTKKNLNLLATIGSITAAKIVEARAKQKASENEVKLLETKILLAETEFLALRSQMNPHFIFNCLTNIKYFFQIAEYEKANFYHDTFAQLLRHILQNASEKLISLKEEIKVLTFYLQLEQLRFEEPFEYEIDTSNVDVETVLIPSMLLQPFIENAIIHGLRPKAGRGKISVVFTEDKSIIKCTINDDGIGRERSSQENRKKIRHKSKGIQLVMDRLALLREQGYHAELAIDDRIENGEAKGTSVIIELSLIE